MDEREIPALAGPLVGNPFSIESFIAYRRAAQQLHSIENALGGLLVELCHAERFVEAIQLILGWGHVQVRNLDSMSKEYVLEERVVPRKVTDLIQPFLSDKLTGPTGRKGEYARQGLSNLIAAAGRCYHGLQAIVGFSGAMTKIRMNAWSACFGQSLEDALFVHRIIRDQNVLILGETGTGKELVAWAIQAGTVGPGIAEVQHPPTAAVNAAAFPENLVESELFGHVRGAFTGAVAERPGRIKLANRGTFFLDEVGDLPLPTQAKLLRVIETDRLIPVGSDKEVDLDVRYIAATSKDVDEMIGKHLFRRDLHQRLAGVELNVPPLRERPEDIVHIAEAFVTKIRDQNRGKHEAFSSLASRIGSVQERVRSVEFQSYPWPGNVRELENTIRTLILNPEMRKTVKPAAPVESKTSSGRIPTEIEKGQASLADVKRWYTGHVLALNDNNLTHTAKRLDIDRSTLKRSQKEETNE
ncbi:MAG: sigma 54-interacting transcriptional regulator [Planctomycetota bacterium]